ncbi:C-C motif chemokine 27 [Trichosurus vulpecula]|uniref:C-C motif chemokine 27 n=1 Tax=Trichosurus vulpecula TaxID=9337 RepID=UPI00186B321C|nr:C-C motif chemokine 27 [Trichosurus vulpecula]
MKGLELTLTLTLLLLNFNPRTALPPDPSISCCTQVFRKNLPSKLLRNIIQVELQEANGDCHIQAYVLHRNHGLPVCIHPKNRSLARWLSRNKIRQKDHGPRPRLNPTP